MISGMSGGDHYKTILDQARQLASAEAAHAASVRDAAEQEMRQMMAMGDFWQDGAWDEAIQAARGDLQKNLSQADVHDAKSIANARSADTAENALHASMNSLLR